MPLGIAPAGVLEPVNAALLAAKILGFLDANVQAGKGLSEATDEKNFWKTMDQLNSKKFALATRPQSKKEKS